MKKRALLILGLALLVAAAGAAYAHWTDTLAVSANVSPGNINMVWQEVGTDDDGLDNTAFFTDDAAAAANSLTDDKGGTEFDGNGGASSDDPSNMVRCTGGVCSYLNGAIARYPKDVGLCTASLSSDGKTLTVNIDKAYPSYHCSVFTQLSNEGNVPVKATAFRMTTPPGGTLLYVGSEWVEATAGDTATCNANPGTCPMGIFIPAPPGASPTYLGMVPVITFDIANGTMCGAQQFDPWTPGGDMDLQAYWFHLEQAAAEGPGVTYQFSFQQDFVNWNEWDQSMCTVTVNGTQVYP